MKMKQAIVFGVAILAGACASSPARSSMKVPLEIPEPPPRVAMEPVPAVIVEEPVEPERPPVVTTEKTPPPKTPQVAATTAAAPPATQPPSATVAEGPQPSPPPELRPAGAAGRTPTAAQVRERLVRTKQKLDQIGRQRLNSGKRADYNSARRFLAQAEEAVKDNNLLLAESSGEKAETLADGLK
jgi:hypothetical protein